MFPSKVVDKIKTRTLHSVNFLFRKTYRLWDNVGKYDTDRQATDDSIVRRMRINLLEPTDYVMHQRV